MNTTGVIAVIVGVFIVLDRIGLLERLKLTRPSASAAVSELDLADRTIERLRGERNEARDKAAQLALERTNEPVLEVLHAIAEQLGQTAASQVEVLDRLAKHNGSFAHMEQAIADLSEGLKALLGTIAELHNIPLKETP